MRWVFLRGIFRSFHTRRSSPSSPTTTTTTEKKKISKHEAKDAIESYENSKTQGGKPGVSVVVSALKACSAMKDLKRGMRIHSESISSGSDASVFVQSALLDMYAKCGSMPDARRVFDSMAHPNVFSWTMIIAGYAQCGDSIAALKLFELMQERGALPNERTFVAVIKACSGTAAREEAKEIDGKLVKAAGLEAGRSIHSQLSRKGFDRDAFVASSLVDMYSKCGSMEEARKVFDAMPKRDLTSWTSVILGYSRSGDGAQALDLFSRMQAEEGFVPDARMFLAAINACTSLAAKEAGALIQGKITKIEALARGAAIHAQVSKLGFDRSDLFVASGLVDMYAKCGSMADARRVFEGMQQRNTVSWTSIILGYAQSGEEPEIALELFNRMQDEGFEPNARTYVAALKACASSGDCKDEARQNRALEKGRRIHSQLSKRGGESDGFVCNALVDMYGKCGSMADARQVFDRMKNYTSVSWNAIIAGYAQAGEGEQALELFSVMKQKGFVPDVPSYVSVLKACSSLAALETGRRIHDELRRAGYGNEIMLVNSLISLYGKCGSLIEAHQLFDSAARKDLVSWSALIAGYGYRGDAEQAFDLFERMKKDRLRPDGVVFLSILTACSHAGLVDRGREYFRSMCCEYGLTPSVEHYTAMVDLLGRANHLDDAVAMVTSIPYEASSTMWMSVLGACRKWKNATLARVAFDALVKIDERDGAAYVLMADTYASVGMLEESSRVNAMRRSARAWKKQGQSWWADSVGKIHRFGSGDATHPQTEEIRSRLRELVDRIKAEGYVPDVSSVLYRTSDEEREAALCGHSEKLAIGCALINSAPGTTIRIAKNLRVCEDCHRATEVISRVEKRVVVCRDANRFHEFRDGKCSCGGFW